VPLARVAGIAVLISLVLAQAAAAKTLRLNWVETKGAGNGYPTMTFKAKSITVQGKRWTVRASVANRSKHAVSFTTEHLSFGDYRFGLIVPQGSACLPPCFPTLIGSHHTTPSFPASLKPGEVWQGSFSGLRTLPQDTQIRIAFGFFVDTRSNKRFSWITNHSFVL
jgi:hypothetical protein